MANLLQRSAGPPRHQCRTGLEVMAPDLFNDGLLECQGIELAVVAVENFAAWRDHDRMRQGAGPLTIEGLGEGIPGITIV